MNVIKTNVATARVYTECELSCSNLVNDRPAAREIQTI